MSLDCKDLFALSGYRMEKAEECLEAAWTLLDIKDYAGAANRSYYAVFHAMRAALALENIDFKRHSGVISHFRKQYIRTGLFPETCSTTIDDLFTLRQDCDYRDFFIISKAEAKQQVEAAQSFLDSTKKYLSVMKKN